MSIDLATVPITLATISGSGSRSVPGCITLQGHPSQAAQCDVTFPVVTAAQLVNWRSAELIGAYDPSTESVKVRVGDGTDVYWLDTSDMTFKEVADTDQWDEEYFLPYLLASMDLWEKRSVQLFVHMERVVGDREPSIKQFMILGDFPAWEGPVAQAVRDIVKLVAEVKPILIVEETTTAERSEWIIGSPNSERQYELTSLVQATVDGLDAPGTLSGGTITLDTPAPPGSLVRIVVAYRPPITVRRAQEVVTKIQRVPMWWAQDLVVQGGLNGGGMPIHVAGQRVYEKRSELRMTVNGIADRVADALAMRQALHEAFGGGFEVEMPCGRYMNGQVHGQVEVIHQGQTSLPMASGVLSLAILEYTNRLEVRRARGDDNLPLYTNLSIDLGGYTVEVGVNQLCE